jgi:hypothetical protein
LFSLAVGRLHAKHYCGCCLAFFGVDSRGHICAWSLGCALQSQTLAASVPALARLHLHACVYMLRAVLIGVRMGWGSGVMLGAGRGKDVPQLSG